MSKQVQEVRKFKIEMPIKELKQILAQAGYEIPKDATWFMDGYDKDKELIIVWERKQLCKA